jgi:plasmid stabilization system protein ParE
MTYNVITLPEAEADFQTLYQYISDRSVQGAHAWANAFNDAFKKLEHNPLLYSLAPESADVDDEVYQILFKTRRGNPYRMLFSVRGDKVFI